MCCNNPFDNRNRRFSDSDERFIGNSLSRRDHNCDCDEDDFISPQELAIARQIQNRNCEFFRAGVERGLERGFCEGVCQERRRIRNAINGGNCGCNCGCGCNI